MRAVFSIFSRIGPVLFRKSRFSSQEEIATLEELCNRFGEVFLVFFPDLNITRKMHELIFYVPKFASRFKTIGLMSEEVGESLHASVNREGVEKPFFFTLSNKKSSPRLYTKHKPVQYQQDDLNDF